MERRLFFLWPVVELPEDVERVTLARALRWHLDDRVLVHEGRTIVLM